MKLLIRIVLTFAMALGALGGAWAQASRYVGTWMVDVQNSKRMRAMVVSQQGDVLRVRWGFQDLGSKIGLATAVVDDAGTLTLTTNGDSVVVLKVVDDSTLRGTFSPRDGKPASVTATRSTPEALAAFNAPGTGAPNAVASASVPVAPAVDPTTPDAKPTGAAPAALAPTTASSGRAFLAKAEVEALATGKKWNIRRASGSEVRWDLREGGALFAANYSTNQRDSGTWSVNEQGQVCVKWRGNSTDRCMAVLREADKLKLFDAAAPNGPPESLSID